ncbi:MAG: sporulation integral membrane protein YtvI [Peptococcaceae bacterium]|jgi:sporulation integral membrane protein YtvI|nr:sporulation integral membrane protein YtvI [Peptococcaceae bacterium]
MEVDKKHPLWNNLNRLVVVALVLLGLKGCTFFIQEFLPVFAKFLGSLASAFLPFIIAIIIAFILEPAVEILIRRLRVRRPLAALLTLVLLLVISGLMVFALLGRLHTELSELAISLPDYSYLTSLIVSNIEVIEKLINLNPQVQNAIFSAMESLVYSLQSWAKSGSVFLLDVLSTLPGVFIVIVVSVVATILMSISFPEVKKFLRQLYPKRWYANVEMVVHDLSAALIGFLRAEAMLVSVSAVITIVGLLLIGNRYAVTIGVLSGVLDILPVVGTGMLFLPWAVVLFITGSVGEGLKILGMWVVIVVVRQFLEPKIMAKSIGLHPLPTLISMYVGLKLLGIAGLILGPTIIIIYEAMRKSGMFSRPRK